MNVNAILHPGPCDAFLNLGQHSRLKISRDHAACGTDHFGEGYGEWSGTTTKLKDRE